MKHKLLIVVILNMLISVVCIALLRDRYDCNGYSIWSATMAIMKYIVQTHNFRASITAWHIWYKFAWHQMICFVHHYVLYILLLVEQKINKYFCLLTITLLLNTVMCNCNVLICNNCNDTGIYKCTSIQTNSFGWLSCPKQFTNIKLAIIPSVLLSS